MREELARAVLRDARQRGHVHVELRRDGPHAIFFCTLCGIRCYSDAALADHLNGNRHARRSAIARASAAVREQSSLNVARDRSLASTRDGEDAEKKSSLVSFENFSDSGASSREESDLSVAGSSTATAASSSTSLKWIGSGQLFLKAHSTGGTPVVEASWFCWQGIHKPVEVGWQEGHAGRMDYAVVVFPYSDRIGRGGDWTSLNAADENDTLSVGEKLPPGAQVSPLKSPEVARLKTAVSREIVVFTEPSPSAPSDIAPSALTLTIRTKPAEKVFGEKLQSDDEPAKQGKDEVITTLRRGWKRKQAKNIDRVCFICHQKLLPGKDVAALVNVKSGKMVCGSRNRRGVFHVFHSFCLIDWISFCEAKAWNASCTVSHNKKSRKSRQAGAGQAVDVDARQDNSGTKTEIGDERAIFCPECQGTGVKVKGAQLERPCFRLSQVFEWLLELIQARKAWMDHPVQQVKGALGLLFVTPEKNKSQGVVQSHGLIHCYSAGSSGDLAATAINREAYLCK